MSSTNASSCPAALAWQTAGLRWYPLNVHLRQRFGERIKKVSIDAGFTCPNVDGTVAVGGCTFCDNRSFSPSRRLPRQSIAAQIDEGIRRLERRFAARRFLAYFQPATNTYSPVARLRALYEEALSHPKIVGLVIGTRPDCLPDDVLDLLTELASRTYLSVEIGVQTMHDRSLAETNRGHDHAATDDACRRSAGRGLHRSAHVILGLPGESRDDVRATACEIARLGFEAVKLHNLYVVRGTPMADQFAAGKLTLPSRDEYVAMLVDFLERLPPTCVVERISGEAPEGYFIAPGWALDKPALRRAIDAEFTRRATGQGKHFAQPSSAAPEAG